MVRDVRGPVLLHVFTEKGHGFEPACKDPVRFHTPSPFKRDADNEIVPVKKNTEITYTEVMSDAIHRAMAADPKVCVLTAAMCAGNKLERIRTDFPDRFFDTGICESHAVAFAGGMAKSGMKPIVDIYSTFLQRSFDQIFQEVALQNLPVVFCMDRAGLCGPDGPTHHGVFDNSYMRIFPNMVVTAPADENEIRPMLDFALQSSSPVSIRYPKTRTDHVPRNPTPIVLGQSETLSDGDDGTIIACGTMLAQAVEAAAQLREHGVSVGVVNARFVKPVDEQMIARVGKTGFVITIEENALIGGFGSAVLEVAARLGLNTERFRVLAIPDHFVEHGERDELLAEMLLDAAGLVRTALNLVHNTAATA
jgi:1-deoxy-D-xylulose-5-phosphate synthase